MEVNIDHITDVDKKIILYADRDNDLHSLFNKAYRKYRVKAQIPGFRLGKTPIALIKKRYGREIELEELSRYVTDVFEKNIRPMFLEKNSVQLIGESEIQDFKWENDQLKVVFLAATAPEFSIDNLNEIKIDIIDIQISDTDIEEALKTQLKSKAKWRVTDQPATESDRVIVDMVMTNEEVEERGIKLVINESEPMLKKALVGKKANDLVRVALPNQDKKDDSSSCDVTIKEVQTLQLPDLTDESIQKWMPEMKTVDQYKAWLKQRLYALEYGNAEKQFRNLSAKTLIQYYDFPIPEVTKKHLKKEYIKIKEKENEQKPNHNTDMDEYIKQLQPQIEKDGKWLFIYRAILSKLPHKELHKDQIDSFFYDEAKKTGVELDEIRAYYASNTQRLETLKRLVFEHAAFVYIKSAITLVPVSKKIYTERHLNPTPK